MGDEYGAGGANVGWDGNIMASDRGRVQQKNIDQLMGNVQREQGAFALPCPEDCQPGKFACPPGRYKGGIGIDDGI